MSECIEFSGLKDSHGYGKKFKNGKHWKAHRLAWVQVNGHIPAGMKVLHRCDNPACVNVEHLFLGSNKDNSQDMVAKGRHHNQKKTHCKQGHEYDEKNTRVTKDGKRYCRACDRERDAERRKNKIGAK